MLKPAKMDYRDVVSVKIYLTDMRQFAKMNEIYPEYFKMPFPR